MKQNAPFLKNKVKKIYILTLPGFCCPFGLLRRFGGFTKTWQGEFITVCKKKHFISSRDFILR